jgi:hypothetical protein
MATAIRRVAGGEQLLESAARITRKNTQKLLRFRVIFRVFPGQ